MAHITGFQGRYSRRSPLDGSRTGAVAAGIVAALALALIIAGLFAAATYGCFRVLMHVFG